MLFVALFSLSLFSIISIPRVQANPIPVNNIDLSHGLIVDENVTMPSAVVNITIEPSLLDVYTARHNITISCRFVLYSNTTHSSLIGFAYPSNWDSSSSSANSDFVILLNDSQVDYIILTSEEISNDTILGEEADWLADMSYAVVNVSFYEGTNTTLSVSRRIINDMADGYFMFTYAVGTGAAWKGPTKEVVTFTITDTSLYSSYSFGPTDGMTQQTSGNGVIATWLLEEFDSSEPLIMFSGNLNLQTPPSLVDLAIVGVVIVVVLYIVVVKVRFKTK